MKHKPLSLFGKGLLMGMVDIIPGLSGGTMALITGVYEELVQSIHQLSWKSFVTLKQNGIKAFWDDINGKFLLPLTMGILSGIFSLATAITYLIEHHALLLWAFFFGLIVSSIIVLIKQQNQWQFTHYLLLIVGGSIAYGVTQLTPAQSSESLTYLFFGSLLAIIAMILPGISGAYILILLGLYEEVLNTVKNTLTAITTVDIHLAGESFLKMTIIGLGIITGLKLFSGLLNWLFTHKKTATLSVLIGFMIGALPKIWPWKAKSVYNGTPQFENISPFAYTGDAQLLPAVALILLGAATLFCIEYLAQKT